MEITFTPTPEKEDIKFIDKDDDMGCIIKVKNDIWEGKIERISSSGSYTVTLLKITNISLDK